MAKFFELLSFVSIAFAHGGGGGGGAPKDFCVIGGGPAGVTSAYLLQNAGKSVVLLEKEDYIGGRTMQIRNEENGLDYKLGAVIYDNWSGNTNEEWLYKQAESFGLDVPLSKIPNFVNYPGVGPIPTPTPEPGSDEFNVIVAALAKYFAVASPIVAEMELRPGFQNLLTVPPEWYSLSVDGFLEQYQLQALQPFFWNVVTSFGYATLADMSALYAIKYYPPIAIQGLLAQGQYYELPYQEIFQKMALELDDVRLGADIKRVTYHHRFNRLHLAHHEKIKCRNVIVAFPQVLDHMNFLRLNRRQRNIFEKVDYQRYFSVVSKIDQQAASPGSFMNNDLAPIALFEVPRDSSLPLPAPIFHYKQHTGDWIVSFVSSHDDITDDNVKSAAATGLNGWLKTPMGTEDIVDLKRWTYFPHVGLDDLDGFYDDLDNIQGFRNTYYLGGLLNFDEVQQTVRHAKWFVEDRFL